MHPKASVLIIDDDPTHQQIYGWIVEAAGFRALHAQVRFDSVDLPDEHIDLVLLDFHLGGPDTSLATAKLLRSTRPDIPVIVLSDALALPAEIAPYVHGFVRKGDPARLVETLRHWLDPKPESFEPERPARPESPPTSPE